MPGPATDRLEDVLEAIARIRTYARGGEARFRKHEMTRDAVGMRLVQIGQAVKDAQDAGLDLPALAPEVPWRSISGMRDRLAHKYWDADHAVVWNVVANEIDKLEKAVKRILAKKRQSGRKR